MHRACMCVARRRLGAATACTAGGRSGAKPEAALYLPQAAETSGWSKLYSVISLVRTPTKNTPLLLFPVTVRPYSQPHVHNFNQNGRTRSDRLSRLSNTFELNRNAQPAYHLSAAECQMALIGVDNQSGPRMKFCGNCVRLLCERRANNFQKAKICIVSGNMRSFPPKKSAYISHFQ